MYIPIRYSFCGRLLLPPRLRRIFSVQKPQWGISAILGAVGLKGNLLCLFMSRFNGAVPAPSSAAILALGGVLATRRRS